MKRYGEMSDPGFRWCRWNLPKTLKPQEALSGVRVKQQEALIRVRVKHQEALGLRIDI